MPQLPAAASELHLSYGCGMKGGDPYRLVKNGQACLQATLWENLAGCVLENCCELAGLLVKRYGFRLIVGRSSVGALCFTSRWSCRSSQRQS